MPIQVDPSILREYKPSARSLCSPCKAVKDGSKGVDSDDNGDEKQDSTDFNPIRCDEDTTQEDAHAPSAHAQEKALAHADDTEEAHDQRELEMKALDTLPSPPTNPIKYDKLADTLQASADQSPGYDRSSWSPMEGEFYDKHEENQRLFRSSVNAPTESPPAPPWDFFSQQREAIESLPKPTGVRHSGPTGNGDLELVAQSSSQDSNGSEAESAKIQEKPATISLGPGRGRIGAEPSCESEYSAARTAPFGVLKSTDGFFSSPGREIEIEVDASDDARTRLAAEDDAAAEHVSTESDSKPSTDYEGEGSEGASSEKDSSEQSQQALIHPVTNKATKYSPFIAFTPPVVPEAGAEIIKPSESTQTLSTVTTAEANEYESAAGSTKEPSDRSDSPQSAASPTGVAAVPHQWKDDNDAAVQKDVGEIKKTKRSGMLFRVLTRALGAHV